MLSCEAIVDVHAVGLCGLSCRLALGGTGLNDTFAVDQSEPRDVILEPYPLKSDTITEFTAPDACLETKRLLSNDPAQT